MILRTDLALERNEMLEEQCKGAEIEEETIGPAKVTRINISNRESSRTLGKPQGKYVTVEVPPFSDDAEILDDRLEALSNEIKKMLPEKGLVLVIGIGNTEITPDALGPKTASMILATRHIQGEIARSAGLEGLRPVAVLSPGVLGQTGMETSEVIGGIVSEIQPSAVIAIDALASRQLSRLGCTVQLSDTGIEPGSGVGNRRKEISESTIGSPVIALGVPTVVDAGTLAIDLMEAMGVSEPPWGVEKKVEPNGAQMVVTPREIDLLIERASKLLSLAINCALHPQISPEDLLSLAS